MSTARATLAPIQPRKEPVQARSRTRFERILAVTVELIVKKGVDAVAMSEIANAAKISIASLYQYFPDKASIVATLADRYNEEGQTCVRNVFAAVEKPEHMITALHEMIDGYYDFFEAVPGAKAIWQASQSDTRLQEIDALDVERLAQTIFNTFQSTLPEISKAEAMRLSRLYTSIIGTIVRSATGMSNREGRAMIELCKHSVLTPSVTQTLNLTPN